MQNNKAPLSLCRRKHNLLCCHFPYRFEHLKKEKIQYCAKFPVVSFFRVCTCNSRNRLFVMWRHWHLITGPIQVLVPPLFLSPSKESCVPVWSVGAPNQRPEPVCVLTLSSWCRLLLFLFFLINSKHIVTQWHWAPPVKNMTIKNISILPSNLTPTQKINKKIKHTNIQINIYILKRLLLCSRCRSIQTALFACVHVRVHALTEITRPQYFFYFFFSYSWTGAKRRLLQRRRAEPLSWTAATACQLSVRRSPANLTATREP